MIATSHEYLVQHGNSGGVGRFATVESQMLRRGDDVIIQTIRGVEIGRVLCNATRRHQLLLDESPSGEVLRKATRDDLARLKQLQTRAQMLFEDCRMTAQRMNLPLEIVDVEIVFDGEKAIVQHLCGIECDLQPFVEELAETHDMPVFLEDLAADIPLKEPAAGGCGKPDCGKTSGGGCSDCGSGGCSSCGEGDVDMRKYFAHLRKEMENHARTPLL